MRFIQINNKKQPLTKFEEEFYKDTFEQWDNAGLIIGTDIIVLDFDNDNRNENKITNYIEANYPTLSVKTTRGKHYYYTMPKDYNFNKSIDCISVMGFQCDYLTGEKAIATIKLNGKVRDVNMPLSIDNLPVLPELFYPLQKVKEQNLSNLENGDGRNDKLFYHLRCIREVYPSIDIKKMANIINKTIFKDKLSNSELNNLVKSVSEVSITAYKDKNKVNNLIYSNARELQERELIPITFYVDTIIPQGLNLICSVPKIGKSWLAIDLCLTISRGLPFLGFNTTQSGCLYLALEDSVNRLQGRLNKVLNGADAPTNFFYSITCDTIANGLIKQLENFIKEHPDVKVIVIDTLQKVRGDYNGSSNYANDYKEISIIKQFAVANGLCIILIHHLRKASAFGDVFERISGTNGIMGTVDTAYTLHKKNRSDAETYLSITGRDVDFNEYILKFDKDNCKWSLIATMEEQKNIDEVAEYFSSTLIKTIKNVVKESNGEWKGTFKTLIKKQKDLFEEGKTSEATKIEVVRFAELLKTIDNIVYSPPKYPEKEGRIQTFTKSTVDTVVL